MNNTHMF